MIVEIFLAGFLFLFIIVTLMVSSQLGNKIVFGESDLDSDALLQDITENPKRFRMSVYFALLEHGAIIALAIVLFIAFSHYNLILGVVWAVARSIEGVIIFNNEKNYWKLLPIAKQYSDSSDAEKITVSEAGLSILKTKHHRFTYAQMLFSIGTLAYSMLFVIYEVVPFLIGWFGVVAAILYGLGNVIIVVKPRRNAIAGLGGLLIFIFEAVLGVWLIYASIFIT
ncbi:MAG: DUF4386 domain-containing protein [Candidatus Thorarchaeota archaeon]